MKKSKYAALTLTLAMGMSLMTGCGKSDGSFKSSADMINKFSAYCELGDYKDIEYNGVQTVVDDAAVQSKIDEFMADFSTTEYVTEGTAKDGDTVNIDYVGTVDGVEFAGGNTNGAGTDLVLGSHKYIDDFEDQIVGHKVGDQFDVEVTFPDDYGSTDLAGKDAVFAVTLNSIANITTPELNDDFVASNTDYKTVDEMKAAVLEDLTNTSATSDENQNKSTIMTLVIDNAVINEYPQQEAEEMLEKTITDVESIAKDYGYDLATYVTAVYGMSSEQDFKDYVSSQIQDILKEKIVICAIAKAEGIEVSKDEIQEYKQSLVSRYGYNSISEFEADYAYTSDDYMYGALADKVSEFILENNTANFSEE